MKRVLAALALAAALSACARRGAAPRTVFPKAPVVVISIDTLRSDHLPDYGAAGLETPALSALRKDGVLYAKAFSTVPLTLPAHLSLFTGLSPAEHGVHDNLGYALRKDVPTLAELLKKEGYATGAAVSAVVLAGAGGAARGFDFYEDALEPTGLHEALGRVQRPGGETEALLEAWIAAHAGGPFLAFLHLYEPHAPYDPPEPFRSRAGTPYDGEIAAADAIVGKLLSFLKARGLYDRSLVVLLSDHGESLGEHGEDEHGVFLYRADLQVPLLLKLPGQSGAAPFAGRAVDAPVSLLDVFPTILSAVGAKDAPARAGTVSLAALAAGEPAPARTLFAETFFPRIHFGWSELASATDGRWHYVEAPKPELYDTSKDPGELENRVAERPDPLRALRTALLARPAAFTAPGAVDEEQSKKLASLGYLSTGAVPNAGPLPDPKDHVETIRLLSDAVARAERGEGGKALGLFERLLAENPRMMDVWELYSNALVEAGRPDDALAARRKLVELAPPGATHALLSVANLCLEIGRPDDAKRHAEAARAGGDPAADEVLARAALARGDVAGAEEAGRAAAAVPKTRRRALLVLARAAQIRGNPARSLELLEEAAKAGNAPLVGLHRLRGDALARLDRPEEAEKEFREEIRLYPRNVDARIELAVVYASRGRGDDVRRTIESLLAEVPTADAYAKAARTLAVLGDRSSAAAVSARGRTLFPKDARLRAAR